MPKKGKETVEVWRPGAKDSVGDRGPATLVATLESCIVWPRSANTGFSGGDTIDRGIVTIDGHNIFVPDPAKDPWEATADPKEILSTDEIRVRGKVERIEGSVGDWRKPNGTRVGYLFQSGRWSG